MPTAPTCPVRQWGVQPTLSPSMMDCSRVTLSKKSAGWKLKGVGGSRGAMCREQGRRATAQRRALAVLFPVASEGGAPAVDGLYPMSTGRWRLRVVLSLVVLSCVLAACTEDSALDRQLAAMTAEQRKELKESLEIRKLTLEVEALASRPLPWLPTWVASAVGAGLVLLIPGTIAVYVNQRTRRAQLRQALHEERLESYPKLVKAAEPLALYFSPLEESQAVDIHQEMEKMGVTMRTWYLGGGGLLLGEEAREAYFLLARALTRACAVQGKLRFPERGDWVEVSQENLKKYGEQLELPAPATLLGWQKAPDGACNHPMSVEQWTFGEIPPSRIEPGCPASKFSDFVYLQRLASHLRWELVQDLEVRRKPV
jgi:hypothetical protein